MNAIGPGEWSDIAIIKAATVPEAPGKPYYISSTADTVTVGLVGTEDNGGSKITEYKLFRDSGNLSSEIDTEVSDYNGADTQHTVTGLNPGSVYRFAYFALNEFGSSLSSPILTIAATELPDKPKDIVVDWARSDRNSLYI